MKVRFVEIEGASFEVPDALRALITPKELAPTVIEAGAVDVVPEIEAEQVPAFGVTRADDPRRRLEELAYDIAGEPAQATYPDAPKWQDVRPEQRRWAENRNTLHLRHADDPLAVMCGSKKLAPEDTVLECPQAVSLAHVCGTCWRRNVEAKRDA